jgi:16S rRNA processing protein RimM
MQVFALAESGERRELEVEDLWPHKGNLVLKFAGVDSISEAELLTGSELQVPGRSEPEPGFSYISDLVGCKVFDGEREIGRVEDVRFGAGEAALLVVRRAGNEYEIPFAEAFLQSLDLKGGTIRMKLPEGLLEVNAPPGREEKRASRRKSQ